MVFTLGIYRSISRRLVRKLVEVSRGIYSGMMETERGRRMSCLQGRIGKYLVEKEDGALESRISMGRLYRRNKQRGESAVGIMYVLYSIFGVRRGKLTC
jgi:hypothetical protein